MNWKKDSRFFSCADDLSDASSNELLLVSLIVIKI